MARVERARDELCVKLGVAQRAEGIVAGEEFIAAIAAERDGDVLAGEAREQIRGEQRAVAERFVESRDDLGEQRDGFVEVEDLVAMPRAELLGDELRASRFVEARFVEADGEGVELAGGDVLRGERGDGGGVDAAAEEDAERHVGHEPALDGALERGAEFFAERLPRLRARRAAFRAANSHHRHVFSSRLARSKVNEWPPGSFQTRS